MSWWIGTYFGHLADLVDAVFVQADDEPAAAQAIVGWFASEEGIAVRSGVGGETVEIDKVFVFPADNYAVYDVGLTATGHSALQCCGGDGWTAGHSGHCPLTEGQGE